MKVLEKITLRLNGRYRQRERILAPKAAREIALVLEGEGFGSKEMNAYFREWLPYLNNMEKFANCSRLLGTFATSKLLGIEDYLLGYKEDGSHLSRFIELFSVHGEYLSFNGIKMALPDGFSDKKLFRLLFHDLVLNYLFKENHPAIREFFSTEGYENEQVKLCKNDVVFDLGANSGFFSACAAHCGCNVYAFEPTKYNRRYLEKTAALNPSITVCPFALSDKKEELTFFVVDSNTGATRDINTLRNLKDESGYEEIVQGIRLDDFVEENGINRIDFIKADIEGKMLTGAKKVLQKFAPKLSLCTYHLPDDPEVMREIILDANPNYKIHQGQTIMYAHV